MNKIMPILLLLLMSLVHEVQAQETEIINKFVIGGSLNFNTQDNTFPISSLGSISGPGTIFSSGSNDIRNTQLSIRPYLGKELSPKLILGLRLHYGIRKYTTENAVINIIGGQIQTTDFERQTNQIGLGVFTRHTLNPDQQFEFFVQPYMNYNLINEEESSDINLQQQKASYIELGVGAGLLYNINDKLRATLRSGGLSYIRGQWEIIDTESSEDFSAFNANFNLGSLFSGLELRL